MKLGFHCNRTGEDVFDAISRIKPKVIKFLTPNEGFIERIRDIHPDVFIIGRHYIPQHLQTITSSKGTPAYWANRIADTVLTYSSSQSASRGRVDAWESYNEVIGESVKSSVKQRYDEFQVQFAHRMKAEGLIPIAGNFGTGNMIGYDWLKYFPGTLEEYTYLGFHEYDWPDLWSLHRQNIDEKGEEGMWLALRYRRIMRDIREKYGDKHKVVITELGMTQAVHGGPDVGPWKDIKSFPNDQSFSKEYVSEDRYWNSLVWYDDEISKNDYVLGACLFVVGTNEYRWRSFDHLGGIIDRIETFQKKTLTNVLSDLKKDDVVTVIERPTGNKGFWGELLDITLGKKEIMDSTRGKPRVQYARKYFLAPQDSTEEEFVKVAKIAYKTRSTVGFSADDAGIGDLVTRRVILIEQSRQPTGLEAWFEEHYSGVILGTQSLDTLPIARVITDPVVPVAVPKPVSDVVIPPPISLVSHTRTKVGLHGSADGNWGNPMNWTSNFEIAKKAKLEAYKLLSNDSEISVDLLYDLNPEMFIIVRLFRGMDKKVTAKEFYNSQRDSIIRFLSKGILWFELHNEPNLRNEGMWVSWDSGAEFSDWLLELIDLIRADFSALKLGYPGLSPGHKLIRGRYSADKFYLESKPALDSCDWVGVHCYWQSEDEMNSTSGGGYYKTINTYGKPLLITEFSNPNHTVAKEDKGHQYVKYYKSLTIPYAAFCFVSSASSQFGSETWDNSEIPLIVGSRN